MFVNELSALGFNVNDKTTMAELGEMIAATGKKMTCRFNSSRFRALKAADEAEKNAA